MDPHLIAELLGPVVGAAVFIVMLLIKDALAQTSANILQQMNEVKDDLNSHHAVLSSRLEAHEAQDNERFEGRDKLYSERFEGFGRTLTRIEATLNQVNGRT